MHAVVLVFVAFLVVSDAFLFLFAKHDSWLFCYKICPLYCSQQRRHDEDAASAIYNPAELYVNLAGHKHKWDRSADDLDGVYIDDELPYYPPISKYDEHLDHIDHIEHGHYWYPHEYHPRFVICKPQTSTTTTTTTPKPTTTTPEPTYICMQCKSKCNYP